MSMGLAGLTQGWPRVPGKKLFERQRRFEEELILWFLLNLIIHVAKVLKQIIIIIIFYLEYPFVMLIFFELDVRFGFLLRLLFTVVTLVFKVH